MLFAQPAQELDQDGVESIQPLLGFILLEAFPRRLGDQLEVL